MECGRPRPQQATQLVNPEKSRAPAQSRLLRPGCARAFTLIEILITVALLSFIIVGLLSMFSQTQRAFTSSMTQTDVLETGRAVNGILANDMSDITPSESPGTLNFYAADDWGGTALVQGIPANNLVRSNIVQKFYFLTKNNLTWTATAYQVIPYYNNNTGVGALYRFTTNFTRYAATSFGNQLTSFTNATGSGGTYNFFGVFVTSNKIADGIVNLRVRAFATNGFPVTCYPNAGNFSPPNNSALFCAVQGPNGFYSPRTNTINNAFAWPTPALGQPVNVDQLQPLNYLFRNNALPAEIELEIGILEPRVLQRYQAIGPANAAAQLQYLSNHIAEVHLFRQRIHVGSVDPYAY